MESLYTLDPDAVALVKVDTKREILTSLASRFAQVYGLSADAVLEAIEDREKLGSTGFGRGVAIPHARMAGLSGPVAAVLKLQAPVAFDAADGMPVDIVVGLLSPEDAGAVHLHALAAISRTMRDERMHEKLANASDRETIYALLANVVDRDAA